MSEHRPLVRVTAYDHWGRRVPRHSARPIRLNPSHELVSMAVGIGMALALALFAIRVGDSPLGFVLLILAAVAPVAGGWFLLVEVQECPGIDHWQ